MMTEIADAPISNKGNSRMSEEGREIARKILTSGALAEALRQVDEMELEAQFHEAQARWRNLE